MGRFTSCHVTESRQIYFPIQICLQNIRLGVPRDFDAYFAGCPYSAYPLPRIIRCRN